MVFRPKYLSVFMSARCLSAGTAGSPSAQLATHRQLPTKYDWARAAASGLSQRPFCIFGHTPERSITMRKYTLAASEIPLSAQFFPYHIMYRNHCKVQNLFSLTSIFHKMFVSLSNKQVFIDFLFDIVAFLSKNSIIYIYIYNAMLKFI